jgi:hypothetical protein
VTDRPPAYGVVATSAAGRAGVLAFDHEAFLRLLARASGQLRREKGFA